MLKNSPFYAGFAVDDIAKAKDFYGRKLGVLVVEWAAACCPSKRATDTRY